MRAASRAAKVFVAMVCAIIVVLEVWSAWHERDVGFEEATRAGSNMALALAQHADQSFNEVDLVLLGVLEHLERNGASAAGLERTHDYMVMNVRTLPQLAGIFVFDERGRWIVNSQPMLETRFNNSGYDYFIHHRDLRTSMAFIGKPVRSQTTGQWILTISRRVNNQDGTFAGVVVAAIDLSYFERYYQQFDIGREGALLFGNNDGTLIFRRPLQSDSIGRDMTGSELYRDHVSKRASGSAKMRSPQDGVVRISSFQHTESYPLFVNVALASDDILEDWRRHVWARGIGVAFLLIALCYGGSRLVGQVARREAAEERAVAARLELEDLYQKLEQQAQKDGLTEVFNRRYFDVALASELARFSRSGGEFSLVMLDVDHFKLFNDTYGHAAGDVCLQKVARAVALVAQRHCDVVARYGGEEFALILPGCDEAGARAVAAELVEAVRALELVHASSPLGWVTVSVGAVSLCAADGFQVMPREIIEIADEALYLAKAQGRNQAVYRDFPAQALIEDVCLSE